MQNREYLIGCAIVEAMDELGVYDDKELEKQLANYASQLANEPQFHDLESNYKKLLFSIIDHQNLKKTENCGC